MQKTWSPLLLTIYSSKIFHLSFHNHILNKNLFIAAFRRVRQLKIFFITSFFSNHTFAKTFSSPLLLLRQLRSQWPHVTSSYHCLPCAPRLILYFWALCRQETDREIVLIFSQPRECKKKNLPLSRSFRTTLVTSLLIMWSIKLLSQPLLLTTLSL
jgi:hypothetical protein